MTATEDFTSVKPSNKVMDVEKCFLITSLISSYSKMNTGKTVFLNSLLTTECLRGRDFISLLRNSYIQGKWGETPWEKNINMACQDLKSKSISCISWGHIIKWFYQEWLVLSIRVFTYNPRTWEVEGQEFQWGQPRSTWSSMTVLASGTLSQRTKRRND